MDAELVADARAFLAETAAYRSATPLLTSVLTSVAAAVADGRRHFDAHWWWVVRHDGDVVGAAMRTAPHGILLGPMGVGAAAALGAACAHEDRTVPSVNAEAAANAAFRTAYLGPGSPVGPRRVRPRRRDRVYELVELAPPVARGEARPATTAETDLATEWTLAFHAEVGIDHGPTGDEAREQVARRIGDGDLLLWWCDGSPAAMAGTVAVDTAPAYARLGPVYTEPSARHRSFGAAVTAALSARELSRGRRVMLYADADYAPSNAAYRRIGFVARADLELVALDPL